MIKPDVIVCWPKNCDYPLWRHFIRTNRNRFNKVIVVFMETFMGDNYITFVINAMDNDQITFLHADDKNELLRNDWRQACIHLALPLVTSDWIWFTEQDFLPDGENFWDDVYKYTKTHDVVGIKEGLRLHPCCLFMKREALDRTNKFFGVIKDTTDHFGQIQKDIEDFGISTYILPRYYHHMAGLSHNFGLVSQGLQPNFKQDEFDEYIEECLKCDIPLDERFIFIAKDYLSMRKLCGK